MDGLAGKVVNATAEQCRQLHPLPLVFLIILGRLQLQVVLVVRSDHELLRSKIGIVAAAWVRHRRLVLWNLLVAHFLYSKVVFLKVRLGLWVVLLFVQVVLQRLLQGIHASIFLARRNVIWIYVVVELEELIVEVLVRYWWLRTEYPWLVPGSSSEHTIRLHQVLLHLMVHNVWLWQLFVFEYLRFCLISSLVIIVSILAIKSMRIVFLFRYFNEEVVFGSTRSTVESNFLWWPTVALAVLKAAAFHGTASVWSSFYLHECVLGIV